VCTAEMDVQGYLACLISCGLYSVALCKAIIYQRSYERKARPTNATLIRVRWAYHKLFDIRRILHRTHAKQVEMT
jgi:hypothetical protein